MDESGTTASAAVASVAATAADPGPPSPLTGCYLLIVVGEPHTADHREIILQRIRKGLLSWDTKDYIVDLEKELDAITTHGPEGEETKYGERLIQYASENLVTEILIHPAVSTLSQCMRNLLSSFTRHRHIIHAGYTFASNGSWAVQDGTFSLADFTEAFQELEVQRILRAYDGNISVDIHCAPEGEWHLLPKESFSRHCKVRINPTDIITTSSVSITKFVHYLSPYLLPAELEATLESSEVVGNIRFSHPTLYVFPGGQGDAALFGINGFNMLLDGGFSRKACFWDFVRHLDRLDAVLLSRLNNSNLCGISSVLERKRQNAVYPQIGHFFCNLQDRKNIPSPDGDKDKDPLIINLLDEGQKIITNLRYLNLTPQVCYRDSEPINLYHKVGHGTLDMYVLNPTRDSKEVKEFVQKWNENDAKMFAANLKANKKTTFPLPNKVSVCALLIWKPSNPRDQYTRILFPGSSPQAKIFEGLEKLRNLDCINYPVCTEKTLSELNLKLKKSKENVERVNISDFKPAPKSHPLDNRSRSKARVPESKPPPPPPTTDNKQATEAKAMENGTTSGTNGVITTTTTAAAIPDTETKTITIQKSESTDSETSASKQKSNEKATPDVVKSRRPVDNKLKSVKSKIDTSKPKTKPIEKKASPTTPKKTVENKDLKETAPKPKPKISPMSTPAKSTKEANNRKVVESKLQSQPHKSDKKEPINKSEKKPIARKPRTAAAPVSKVSSSPKRVIKPDSFSKKIKLEKEATDSSTVSTPSIDQDIKRDVSKLTPEELEQLKVQEIADLKEDREVVEEIEAVFRKDEIKQKIEKGVIDLDEKQEPEEYLIIEKEIIDSEQKDDETQKHTKDSDESEKPKESDKYDETLAAETADKLAQDAKVPDMISADSGKDSGKSPEEKVTTTSSEKKTGQSKDLVEPNVALESQPDERISATVESGATTAPTLPEDERITLDEIKEDGDQIIEEKHVKEDTKEKDIPTIQLQSKTLDSTSPKQTPVAGLKLDRQTKIRDIVKTPDEVADLPVHEVVDTEHFDYTADVPKAISDNKEHAEKIAADDVETEPEINNDLAAEKDAEMRRVSDTMDIKKEVGEEVEEPGKEVSKESSKRSSLDTDEKDRVLKEPEIIDKHDLGRKSPKEREEDVAKIVASVAEVLKSDAPLEEFEGKIPLDISSFKTYTAYTTELRETHITTMDSPIEEKLVADIDTSEPKIVTIIEEDVDAKEKEKSPTSVHRMLVTASSEDGGEETLICTTKKTEEMATDDAGKISEEEMEIKEQTEVSSLPVITKPIEAYSEEETSKESTLPTEELKEIKDAQMPAKSAIADSKTSEQIKPDELQVSRDIPHDGKTTPTIEIDTVEDVDSGTSSPDEKVLSGDAKEDTTEKVKEEVHEEVDNSVDAKDDNKDDEDEQVSKQPDIPTRETSVDTETSVSPLTSGKSSPDQFDKELSTPISSGKASPDTKQNGEEKIIEKVVESEAAVEESSGQEIREKADTKETLSAAATSGKTSPESAIDKDTSKSPDIQPITVISGKQSPIDKIEKAESLKSSGKQTPESLEKDKKPISPLSSGKASPDILTKPDIADSSDKQTPEIQDAESRKVGSSTVSSGKQSPDTAQTKETEIISSKRSSVASDSIPQPKDAESVSGKVTPELLAMDSRKSSVDIKEDKTSKPSSRKSSITTKEKLDEDKVDTMSIKSTTSSGKQSPTDGKMKVDNQKSGPPSGRQTPEKLELLPKDLIKSTTSSGKQSPAPTLSTKDADSRKASTTSEKLDVADTEGKSPSLSGKASPQIPPSETEKMDSRKSSIASEKISPDKLETVDKESVQSAVGSDKQSPENIDKKSNICSGKSTPDNKDTFTKDEKLSRKSSIASDKSTEVAKLEDVKSRQSSGKATPDIPATDKTDKDSRKSSIDSDRLKSDQDRSGKQSPEAERVSDVAEEDDVKLTASSRKQSEHSVDVELQKAEDKRSSVSSGMISPYLEEKTDKPASGKATPLANEDITSRKASISAEKEKIELVETDRTSVKSDVSSGKATPDVEATEKDSEKSRKSSVASAKEIDKPASPEVIKGIADESGKKSCSPVVEKQTDQLELDDSATTKSGTSTGKQTPELAIDKVDKPIEKSSAPEKQSPDPSESIKSTPHSEKPTSDAADKESIKSGADSGKQTPDIPLEKMSRKSSLMSDKLPSDIIDKDSVKSSLSSGKQSPDIPILESSRKSSITSDKPIPASGKGTPDIQAAEEKDSRKSSIATEKPQADNEISRELDETSRKSSITSDKPILASGKATPDIQAAEEKDSRKSSIATEKPQADKEIQREFDETSRKSSITSDKPIPASGKGTPDIQAAEEKDSRKSSIATEKPQADKEIQREFDETSRKSSITSDKPIPASGKGTPDIQAAEEKDSRKSSIATEKPQADNEIPRELDETSRKSSITSDKPIPASGKATPDIQAAEEKDSRKSNIATEKPEADKEILKESDETSSTDRKSSFASEKPQADVIEKESLKSGSSSGSHSPASADTTKPLETPHAEIDSRKSGVASEKPEEFIISSVQSGRATPAEIDNRKQSIVSDPPVSEIDKQSEKSGISSGKQTPDIPESGKESAKSDQLEIEDKISTKSSASSGKHTPDNQDAVERDSNKKEKLDIDEKSSVKSGASSGKQTPEPQLKMESSTPDSRKASILSDKKDLEVEPAEKEGLKSGASSGKHTPVVTAIEKDVIQSGKQTPGLEDGNRKSSTAKIEQLQIDEKDVKSGASSGKQSPEVPKELKSTTSSGRQTPDQADSTKSLAGSEQQTPDNAPTDDKAGALKSAVSPIKSGKVTPELTMDNLEPIKSTSTSGRVTPEITIEQTSPTATVTDEFLPIMAEEEKIEAKVVERTESAKVTQESEEDACNGVPSSLPTNLDNGKSSESIGETLDGDPKKSVSVTDDVSASITTAKKSSSTEAVVESIKENDVNGIKEEVVHNAIADDHFINGIERDSVQIESVDSRKSSITEKPGKSVMETTVDTICEVTKDMGGEKISSIPSKDSTDLKEDKKSDITDKSTDKAYRESNEVKDKLESISSTKEATHIDKIGCDLKTSETNFDEASGTDSSNTDKFKYVDTFLAEEKAIAAVHSDDPQKITLVEKQEKTEKSVSSESGVLPGSQLESTISKTSAEKISSALVDDVKAVGDSIISSISATDTTEKLTEIKESPKSAIEDLTTGIKSTSEAIAKSVESSKASIAQSLTKTEESAADTKDLIKTGIETVTKEIKEDFKESKEVLATSLIETVEKGKEQITKESKDIKEAIQEKSVKFIEEVQSTIDVGKSSIETAKSEAEAKVKDIISEAKSTIESGKHNIDNLKTEIKEETNAVVESTKTVIEEVKSICDDKVKETVQDAKVIEESVQKSVETLKSNITDEVQKLKDVTQSTTETIKKSGEDVIKEVSKEVHSKEEQIEETIDKISKNVETYGENIITSCDTKIKDIAKDVETTKESVKTSIDTLSKEVSENAKQIQSNIKETMKMGESVIDKFTKDLSDTVKSSTSSFTSSLDGGKKEPQPKLDATKAEALDKLDKELPVIKDQTSDPMSASIYGGLPAEIESQIEASSSANLMTTSFIGSQLPDNSKESKDSREAKEDPIASWGKPLGLPSPIPTDNKGTPKKERKLPPTVSVMNRLNDKKNKKINPIYVELSYVPHHGNSNYTYVDFFKKVRARYYVFSGIEPSKEVYDALLEAKMTWEDNTLEVTIIPTYDTDVLGYWVAENEDALAKYKIDLSPSASRCTINLQDHETSCSAYRLEF